MRLVNIDQRNVKNNCLSRNIILELFSMFLKNARIRIAKVMKYLNVVFPTPIFILLHFYNIRFIRYWLAITFSDGHFISLQFVLIFISFRHGPYRLYIPYDSPCKSAVRFNLFSLRYILGFTVSGIAKLLSHRNDIISTELHFCFIKYYQKQGIFNILSP